MGACGDDDAMLDAGADDASSDAPSDAGTDSGEDAFLPDSGLDAGGDVGPACTDGVQNNDETDVDCGGLCSDCEDGLMCSDFTDCESGLCTGGVCVGPTCGDGMVNGGEACDPTDPSTPCCLVDCSAAAGVGMACGADPDGEGCGAAPQCSGLDASVASCVVVSEMNGTACVDDGMFCTGAETCQEGACASAGDPCPGADGDDDCAEACDEAADACTGFDAADSACDDGLFCTTSDACDAAGVCVGSGDPCPGADGDGNCAESCDDVGDSCTGPDIADSACDDGSFCTATDVCDAGGMCVGSGDPCPSSQVCSLEACVAQTLFFFGDFVTNSVEQMGTYDPAADATAVLTLDGLSGDDIRAFAFSADGSLLAVSGRDTDASPSVINIYSGDFTGAPVTVVSSTSSSHGSAVEFSRLVFSPDGLQLAFTADLEVNGGEALYVVPTAGGIMRLLSPSPADSGLDVRAITWVGNTHIAFAGDVVTSGQENAYTVNVTGVSPVIVPLVPEASITLSQKVSTARIDVDAAGRIYFASDHADNTVFLLYRANLDGTGLEIAPGSQVMQTGGAVASTGGWSISPDHTQLAFAANAPNAAVYEMYVLDLSPGASAVRVSDIATSGAGVRGASVFIGPVWSPDATLLAVTGDWGAGVDNDNAAFLLPTTAPAGGVRIVGPATAGDNQDANQVRFSSDGAYLFIRGDLITNNNAEVYSTGDFTTPDQDPSTLLVQSVPAGGDVYSITSRP